MKYYYRVINATTCKTIIEKGTTLDGLQVLETLHNYDAIDRDNDPFVYQYRTEVNIATNIEWDYDLEKVFEKVDAMLKEDVVDYFGIDIDIYNNMTTSELHDYVADVIHECPTIGDEFLGLPDTVIIPKELGWIFVGDDHPTDIEYQNIADWLSGTYGCDVTNYKLEEA